MPTIQVVYLDGDERHFHVGTEPGEFHTWYTREATTAEVAVIVFKRYPAPSGSRVVIPLAQVRWYEVVIPKENDEQARPALADSDLAELREAMVPNHLSAVPDPAPSPAADGAVTIEEHEAHYAAHRFAVHNATRRAFWLKRRGATGKPFSAQANVCPALSQAPCRWFPLTSLQAAYASSWDWACIDEFRILGANECCAGCLQLRIGVEPEVSEPEREVPGEVADGPGVLEGLGRPEVREPARAGERSPAGPGGLESMEGAGLEAVVMQNGDQVDHE